MATQTTTTRIDDLDGNPDESVKNFKFGVDGVEYEIDLNEKNATALGKALGRFVEKARVVRPERKPAKVRKTRVANGSGVPRVSQKPIREWANANGYQLAERGRINSDVVAAYEAAHLVITGGDGSL